MIIRIGVIFLHFFQVIFGELKTEEVDLKKETILNHKKGFEN